MLAELVSLLNILQRLASLGGDLFVRVQRGVFNGDFEVAVVTGVARGCGGDAPVDDVHDD